MTKQQWYDHIMYTIELTDQCVIRNEDKSDCFSCADCTHTYGPCRKNAAIHKFAKLIELLDK